MGEWDIGDSRVSGVGHLWGGFVEILVNNGIPPLGVTQQHVADFHIFRLIVWEPHKKLFFTRMNNSGICLFYVDRSDLRLSQILYIFPSYSFYQQSEISGTKKKTTSPSSWRRWETNTKKLKGMQPVRDFVSFKSARVDFLDETNSKGRSIFA